MTTHHRLYTRPLGLWSIELPLLQVTGSLPSYVAGEVYEGRLPITGNVGDCTVEWLTGELPPGATVTVDNATAEVVVAWPAYVPEFTTEFLNGDFEQGNVGWLATAGWRIDTYADWPAFGAIAIYDGAGPGIMESVAMPCSPGQTITARGLWGQGPSNKKNINLWTCLIWRDENRNVLNDLSTINADGFYREEEPWVGNKVHDQANGQQHWSTVTDTAPPGTASAAVRHAVHRRRYQRQVEVYKTEWNLPRQLGSPDMRDWCITLRVRDSAGRSADWSGCVEVKVADPLAVSIYGKLIDWFDGDSLTPDLSQMVGRHAGMVLTRIDSTIAATISKIDGVSGKAVKFFGGSTAQPGQGTAYFMNYSYPVNLPAGDRYSAYHVVRQNLAPSQTTSRLVSSFKIASNNVNGVQGSVIGYGFRGGSSSNCMSAYISNNSSSATEIYMDSGGSDEVLTGDWQTALVIRGQIPDAEESYGYAVDAASLWTSTHLNNLPAANASFAIGGGRARAAASNELSNILCGDFDVNVVAWFSDHLTQEEYDFLRSDGAPISYDQLKEAAGF